VRALITGGQGFVGRHLEAHLEAAGDEVTVLDLETDVTDLELVADAIDRAAPEAIYHLAALAHVGESWNDPSQVLLVNVIGTANVLTAARQGAGNPRILMVSSAEVYGAVREAELPLTEDSRIAPVSPYAASKAAAEQVALQAFRAYGQPVTVVRPFNHVGPGQAPSFAVPAMAKRILEAKASGAGELLVGTLSTRRDFTDVRDVVKAYRAVIERGEPGEVYNVASGRDVSIGEILEKLLALVGVSLERVVDPGLLRPVDVPVLRGSFDKLAAVTGWAPQISLDETLEAVINWLEVPS
jgi:GDP-4-dehydro-6-deoxy-D-mannose reductase